eukprot:TRINITY_DN1580_c0_g1_i1.p3 TRINITY_DN1580_c0_g1~~TRINITY_DN1580_c0_g1_i1.p3  ORF type:complete len:106 (-),score=28.78 TRINITY_DN1580_c0_g1_i1:923-1240(-)
MPPRASWGDPFTSTGDVASSSYRVQLKTGSDGPWLGTLTNFATLPILYWILDPSINNDTFSQIYNGLDPSFLAQNIQSAAYYQFRVMSTHWVPPLLPLIKPPSCI